MFFYLKRRCLISVLLPALLKSKVLPYINCRCHQARYKTSPFSQDRKMDRRDCPTRGCCLINIWFPVPLCQEKSNDARTSNTTTPPPPSPGTSLSTSQRPYVRMSGMPCVSTPDFLSLALTCGRHGGLGARQPLGLDRWMDALLFEACGPSGDMAGVP